MLPVVSEALNRLNIKEDIEVIYDNKKMKQINLKYTPALEINGTILYQGKYPGVRQMVKDIKKILNL